MSLNPSNIISELTSGVKTFPNLARRWDRDNESANINVFDEVDSVARRELDEAGITHPYEIEPLRSKGEVPTKVIGQLYQWGFHRAWYYWIADGPGIPPDVAEEFHKTWGTQCRVAGHCGCPSPIEWHHGFAVGMYHVDTQSGLNAFAELLRSIYVIG